VTCAAPCDRRARARRAPRRRGLATLCVLAVAAAALASCGGTPSPAPSASPSRSDAAAVVAHVNGQAVTRGEVDLTIVMAGLSSQTLTYRQALEAVIREHLLRAEAARLGVVVTAADVQARLQQVAGSLGGVAALQSLLSAGGVTVAQYRQAVRDGLLAERLAARKFPHVAPSTRQVVAFYRAHRAQLTTPAAVRLAEIVVKTRSLADAVIDRLRAGYPFAEVARAYSMDSESVAAGGVVGWVETASLPPALARATAAARAGAVSRPVTADGVWYVVKVLGRRSARTQSLSAARPAIVAELVSERRGALLQAWLGRVRAAARVTTGA
jgi:parvulin-like peptidyl-prolyl isomerase